LQEKRVDYCSSHFVTSNNPASQLGKQSNKKHLVDRVIYTCVLKEVCNLLLIVCRGSRVDPGFREMASARILSTRGGSARALTTYYYGGGGGKERGQSFCRYIVPLGTRGFGFWRASLSSLLTRWHACARAGPASVAASRRDWPRGTSFILTPPFSFTRSLVAVPVKEEKQKKERLLIGW
ncbi:hypothetical protein BHE74_00016185, partial [Ensete ventricosum]